MRERFDSILQYPLCVDYIYVLPWMAQKIGAHDHFLVSREDFHEYLKSYRRSDPNTFIPPLEIPDTLVFRTVQYGTRDLSFGASLKWEKRPTGPGFIRMIGTMTPPSTRSSEKILDFTSITFVWYSDGSPIRRVLLKKVHVHHREDRFDIKKYTLAESWVVIGEQVVSIVSEDSFNFRTYEIPSDLNRFAVHEDVFPDEMSRFLFVEELNRS